MLVDFSSFFWTKFQTNAIALLFFKHVHSFPDMFLNFSPQICPKKTGYTIFSWVFENVCLCPFIFLHFAETWYEKKTRLHLLIHDWCFRPYISECFLHFSSQMLPKQRGYTIFHLFFTDFCCCPFSFLHFCWNVLQKKRGYTFEGSNDKKCGAFYALGRPWKFIVNNST